MKKMLALSLLLLGVVGVATLPPIQAQANAIETSEVVEVPLEENRLPEWAKEILDPTLITLVISATGNIIVLFKLARDMAKSKKAKSISNEEVVRMVNEKLIPLIEKKLVDYTRTADIKSAAAIEKLVTYFDKMMKITVLAQENTPQSRLAILDLVADTGFDKSILEEAKQIITQQEEERIQKEEDIKATIEEVELDTFDSIVNKL